MTTPDNYMRAAAEKAINDLQQQVNHATDAAERAETSAAVAQSMAARWKKLTVVGLAIVAIVLGLGAWSFLSFRQASITACNIGNERAHGTVVAIDELVKLLEGPHPTKQVLQEAATYEAYVASENQQRDCTRVYSIIP